MLFLCHSVFSTEVSSSQADIIITVKALKDINGKLLFINDEQEINQLLSRKTRLLDQLSNQIKQASTTDLPSPTINTKLALLESRIKLNTEKENPIAALRDKAKLEGYKSKLAIIKYLEYTIESSKKFQSIESIVKHTQWLLGKSQKIEKKLVLPESVIEGKVFLDLKKNYHEF